MMTKLSAFALAAAVALTAPLQAVAQQTTPGQPAPSQWYGPGPWHMWGGWGGGYGFWWGPFLMMLMFALVVGVAVYVAGRRHGPIGGRHWGPGGRHPSHSALEIVNERFAKGEIQQAEFEAKRAAILRDC